MQINSIDLPTNTFEQSAYKWTPPTIVGYNGNNAPIRIGGATLELVYPRMHPDDWEFWTQTILGGEDYAEFSQAQLFNIDGTLTSYTHCIVNYPNHGQWENGYHAETSVLITDIY